MKDAEVVEIPITTKTEEAQDMVTVTDAGPEAQTSNANLETGAPRSKENLETTVMEDDTTRHETGTMSIRADAMVQLTDITVQAVTAATLAAVTTVMTAEGMETIVAIVKEMTVQTMTDQDSVVGRHLLVASQDLLPRTKMRKTVALSSSSSLLSVCGLRTSRSSSRKQVLLLPVRSSKTGSVSAQKGKFRFHRHHR